MITWAKAKGYLIAIGAALLAGLVFALKMIRVGREAQKAETYEQQREIEDKVEIEAEKVKQKFKEKLRHAQTTDSFDSLNDD